MEFDSALLASIASGGLGRWVEFEDGTRKYSKDDDCIPCLKDLQGFFKYDHTEERPAFFAVAKYNFARTDIVPLLVTYPDDYELVYNALKVCTHLTMPSPDIARNLVNKEHKMIVQVCEAFTQTDGAIEVIMTLLAEPLSRHPKMSDRDASLVELVIVFLRNLVASSMPPNGASFIEMEEGRRVHSDLLRKFKEAEVMDLLLTIAQHARERPFKSQSSALLEIFLNTFNFTSADQLMNIPDVTAATEIPTIEASERERMKKKAYQAVPKLPAAGPNRTVARFGPSRQQFAGAVFMRRHKDHSSNILIRHSPAVKELPPMSQAPNKKYAKAQVKEQFGYNNRQTMPGVMVTPKDVALMEWQRGLLEKFLTDAYTPLVGQVFKEAQPGLDISRLEESEFEKFVRFVGFCTKYIRIREEGALKEKLRREREKSGEPLALRDDADTGDKPQQNLSSPFSSISATMGWDAFHMIQVLFLICIDKEIQRARDKDKPYRSHVLLYSLGPLMREMLMTLDLARVAGNEADRQAADRLQRKLFHNDDKTGLLHVITQLIREYKFHLHPRSHGVHLVEILHVVLMTLDRLTHQGSFQVSKTMKKHKRRKKKNTEADKGGDQSNDNDNPAENADPSAPIEDADKPAEPAVVDLHEEEDQEEEEEEEEETAYEVKELEFDAPRRLRSACAHPNIVQFYVWLLQSYRKNSDLTNDAILSFLERVSTPAPRGMGLHCMLWQLSVIRTLYEIMSDSEVLKNEKYKRLLKFCIYIVRGLFKRLCPDLSEQTQKLEEANAKQADLEEQLKNIRILHCGEDDLDAKAESLRKDIHEAKVAAHEASIEIKMKEKCASLAFVEILFCKLPTVAESIAEEYNWKRHLSMQSDMPEGAQVGFASYKAPPAPGHFTEEQTQILIDTFESCNGKKDCLDTLVFEFGGAFKKVHISRKLKELGLEKGKLTERQKNMIFIFAERYADQGTKKMCQTVQEQLGGGFTVRQIKNHMKNLGCLKDTDKSSKKRRSPADEMSDDDSSDQDQDGSAEERSGEPSLDVEKAFDDMLAEIHETNSPHPSHSGLSVEDRDVTTSPVIHKEKEIPALEHDDQDPKALDLAQAEARRKALEMLRKRHKPSPADENPEEAVQDTNEENASPTQGENTDTNMVASPAKTSPAKTSPVKTFGRRLLKKNTADEPATALDNLFGGDDLEDF
jgi:timeless